MTLNQLRWSVFDDEDKQDLYIKTFIQLIQEQVAPKTSPETSFDEASVPVLISRRGGRLNTKLKAQSTIRDIGDDLQIENFWDRNFPSDEEVAWYKFQKCFLNDYETQLAGELSINKIRCLLSVLITNIPAKISPDS